MRCENTPDPLASSPYATIWSLTWPQVVMMIFHFLIGFVDVWVAGRINREVQASLGIISQSLFFFLIIATAVANGSVAAISQSIGAGLERRAGRYVGLCIQSGLVFGVVILGLGLPLRGPLLSAMQVPAEILPIADDFLYVYLLLLPAYYLLIICNAVFRARKDVLVPLYSMGLVTAANAVGDLGLGLGWWGLPNLGYRGIAWATFWSVTLGTAYNVLILWRRGDLVRRNFAPWRWTRRALPYLHKVAWPSGLMQVVWHSGYLVLYAITGSLPRENIVALAGMAAGIRVESLLFLPAFAFNFTAGILIGHYLGAGRPAEAKRFGYRILGMGMVMVILLCIGVWHVIEPIAAFIAPDAQVQAEAVNYLFWNLIAIPFTLTSMILAGAFNGAGASMYNMLIMGLSTWLVRLPLAWWLGHVAWQSATGVWVSMLASQAVQSSIMLWAYSRWNWASYAMTKNRRTIEICDES